MLTTANLVYYLLDRGFVTARSVLDGEFLVLDQSRRNRTFIVECRDRPGYVVKQVKKWRQPNFATLECEARCYWLAQNDPAFAAIAPLLPKCYAYDAEQHILVLELLPQAEDLYQHHRRTGKFPLEMARLLGDSLGACHAALGTGHRDRIQSTFPAEIPWVFSVHQRSEKSSDSISPANLELLRIVRNYPEFGQALERLQPGWRASTLIHGDMKWAHCILTNADSQPRLRIIDWELALYGDPCWDAGSILQEYLNSWIRSLPIHAAVPAKDVLRQARYPLEEIQPAIRSFWRSYLDRLLVNGSAADEMLQRSVSYGAARMIQSAWESMQHSPQITPSGVRMLQVSLNILLKPEEAIAYLLGL